MLPQFARHGVGHISSRPWSPLASSAAHRWLLAGQAYGSQSGRWTRSGSCTSSSSTGSSSSSSSSSSRSIWGVSASGDFQHRRLYSTYSDLPEEVDLIREQAKQFAEEVLFASAAKNDATHSYPKDEIKQLGELGFLGINVPEEYGGPGASSLAYAVAMEEVSRGCPTCGLVMSINNSLFCGGVANFGTEEQKKEILPAFASGEKIGCFALSEPGKREKEVGHFVCILDVLSCLLFCCFGGPR